MTSIRIAWMALLLLTAGLLLTQAATAREHDCSFCHNLHGGGVVPEASQVELICLNCHGAGGSSILKADIHKNKPGKGQGPPEFTFSFTCADCHNPHEGESFANWRGSLNTRMVGRADLSSGSGLTGFDVPGIGFRNVVFPTVQTVPATDGGFVDRDGVLDSSPFDQFDGVCETCHSDPDLGHHPNELCGAGCGDKTHNKNKACTQCHAHDNFFWK
jgi:hypothetical protein